MLTAEDKTYLKTLNLMLTELNEDYLNGQIMQIDYEKMKAILIKMKVVESKIDQLEKKAFN